MKKTFKKICFLAVTAILLLNFLGCSKKQVEEAEGSVEIKVALLPLAGDFVEFQRILGRVNEITKKKINTTVSYQLIDETSYFEQITLMISSGEQLDLIFSADWLKFFTQVSSGQLKDLKPYLQYMPDIINAVGMDRIEPFAIDGKIYGVATIRDFAQTFGYLVQKDIAEKYGINSNTVKSLDELTPYFERMVKEEGIPSIAYEQIGTSVLRNLYASFCDSLGDYNGVLMDYKGRKVVNMFATDEYKRLAELMYKWNQIGAIPKDLSTSTVVPEAMLRSGIISGYTAKMKPGYAEKTSNIVGKEVYALELVEPLASTSTITNVMYSIPINSRYPERAAMYLNLCYADPEIINLLTYGEEGIDYVLNKDGIAEFPPGVTPNNAKYNPGWGWLIGNQFVSHVFSPDSKDIWERTKAFNDNARKSEAFGFMFNPLNVSTEITAVENVKRQYENAIGNGDFNPDDIIPRFLRELENAGMSRIVTEKQKQLDEWFAKK
jgi:putative aldouronate transport system substrate-binding protein